MIKCKRGKCTGDANAEISSTDRCDKWMRAIGSRGKSMMNRGAPYLPERTSHTVAQPEDGAKTEISIFRPLRGGSMLISAPCPVRETPFKTQTRERMLFIIILQFNWIVVSIRIIQLLD